MGAVYCRQPASMPVTISLSLPSLPGRHLARAAELAAYPLSLAWAVQAVLALVYTETGEAVLTLVWAAASTTALGLAVLGLKQHTKAGSCLTMSCNANKKMVLRSTLLQGAPKVQVQF